jgi:Tol biopolymer transport system component
MRRAGARGRARRDAGRWGGRAVVAIAIAGFAAACSDAGSPSARPADGLDAARTAFAAGSWNDALAACDPAPAAAEPCAARYCAFLARTLLFVDELNDFLLPNFRSAEIGLPPGSLERYVAISQLLDRAAADADEVLAGGCGLDVDTLPLRLGAAADLIVDAEVRGRFTPRSAALMGAIVDSVRYVFASTIDAAPVPPPPDGSAIPGLPALLERIRAQIALYDRFLAEIPADPDPARPQGGWLDRSGDGAIGPGDELLLDLFVPGTGARTFDLAGAELVTATSEPLGALARSEDLPPARCGYQRWHVDTLLESRDVGTTDGMSFSPDGARLALPIKVDGRYEVHVLGADGRDPRCLTCDTAVGWDDGVRWRPGSDVLLFVSSRDHPAFVGGAGGGFGQELYAMRADGSQQTRLTTSPSFATNYHANWSFDGSRIVWGTTAERTWDVMIADFVDDESGMRLENVRRLTRDTSWWETHGFTLDGASVITTNTRAGWQSADLYAISLADGRRTRLTDDLAWDEHAHLSPDGRKLSWISARWRPASMLRLTDGSLSPGLDFFWIAPAILFSFYNPPAGFSTELTLMDADGSHLQRLTFDDAVVADNAWSPDGRSIVYRTTPNAFPRGPSSIRVLTFDDCAG